MPRPQQAATCSSRSSGPGGAIELAWSAPSGETPAGYDVYRNTVAISDVSGLTPLAIGEAGPTFTDIPVADGEFHYVVVAVDAYGNPGPPSNDASASAKLPWVW